MKCHRIPGPSYYNVKIKLNFLTLELALENETGLFL
jgi:hypothetical protein